MNLNRKSWIIPLGIFLGALGLRLSFMLVLQHQYPFLNHPSSDVAYYQQWAEQIAFRGGSPATAFAGLPLYPYFLAVLKRLTLNHATALRFLHIALGALNCVLLYFLGKQVFNTKTAWLAAGLACLNFTLVYYDWLMMPVPLLITLSLIVLIVLTRGHTGLGIRDWLILGVLFGLGTVGDGKFVFVFALTILVLGNRVRKAGRPVMPWVMGVALPMLLGYGLIVGTVTVRNRVVSGDWVFITSQSGLSLYAGNNPQATGIYENPDFIRPDHRGQDEDQQLVAQALAKRKLGPGEVAQFWRNQAWQFIANHPADYGKLLFKKAKLFLTENERANDLDLLLLRAWRERVDWNPYRLMLPLSLLGLVLAWRKGPGASQYLNVFLFSQFLFTLIFFLTNRHRASVVPILILYESYALVWLWEKVRQAQWLTCAVAIFSVGAFMMHFRFVPVDEESLQFVKSSKWGVKHLQDGRAPEAIRDFQAALAIRPNDTNSWYNLGNAYLALNQLPQARDTYLRALQTCDYNVDAMFNLAYTYSELGEQTKALSTYQRILTYAPNSLDVRYRIAMMHLELNQCQEVEDQVKSILAIEPALKPQLMSIFQSCLSL